MSIEVGSIVKGKVTGLQSFGAFVAIDGENVQGLIHISEVSNTFVDDVSKVLSVGQDVEVKVIKINEETGKISLSIKALMPPVEKKERKERKENAGPRRERRERKDSDKGESNYRDPEGGAFTSLADKLANLTK